MKILLLTALFLLITFLGVSAQETHVISQKYQTALPSEYPNGVYVMSSEYDAPYSWPIDAGTIFGFKPAQSNFRHSQFIVRDGYFRYRTKDGGNDAWQGWRTILTVDINNNVGIGTTTPGANLHISNSGSSMHIENTNVADWAYLRLKGSGSYFFDIAQFGSNDFLEFRPQGSTTGRMRFYQDGSLIATNRIMGEQYLAVNKAGSYRVAMNGQSHGYISGRNESLESKFQIHSSGDSYFNGGNVGIGTNAPDEKLTVKGTIHTEEVRVDLTGALEPPDYVFDPSYDLMPLDQLSEYLRKYRHLPEIPSGSEMEENGIKLKEMNLLLLKKVEELTLYVIQLEERDKEYLEMINELKLQMEELKSSMH